MVGSRFAAPARRRPSASYPPGGLLGLGSIEAAALYDSGPVAVLLRHELVAWALEHTHTRLNKPQDQDDLLRKWVAPPAPLTRTADRLMLRRCHSPSNFMPAPPMKTDTTLSWR